MIPKKTVKKKLTKAGYTYSGPSSSLPYMYDGISYATNPLTHQLNKDTITLMRHMIDGSSPIPEKK